MVIRFTILLAGACMAFTSIANAKDLGVIGSVFEIKERDLLELIQTQLTEMQKSGALALHQETLIAKTQRALQTPAPVKHVQNAVTFRTFTWDPSITLTQDLKTHANQLIYAKGTRLNPLSHVSLTGQWLFFNSENNAQLTWAKSHYKVGDKLILVRGSAIELQKDWNLPVYFDQHGLLTRKIGIMQVPARAYSSGSVLRVEEIPVPEEPAK